MFDGAEGFPSSGQSISGVGFGYLESVDATLYGGATQFTTDWYMANDNATNSGCAALNGVHLIQDGWAETSWYNPTVPEVFEYDSQNCGWEFFGQYPLGQYVSAQYAVSGYSNGYWMAWIYWNNTWNALVYAYTSWQNAPILEQNEESFNDNANVHVPSVPVHENTGTDIYTNGTWQPWTSSSLYTGEDTDPTDYCLDFYDPYQDWAVGSSGCP